MILLKFKILIYMLSYLNQCCYLMLLLKPFFMDDALSQHISKATSRRTLCCFLLCKEIVKAQNLGSLELQLGLAFGFTPIRLAVLLR